MTSKALVFFVLNGWTFAQIAFSFFVSVFIQKSKIATIVGYGIAIYFMAISNVSCIMIYQIPLWMPWYYHFIPTFSFVRAFQHMTIECLFHNCYQDIYQLHNTEGKLCIAMLYI